MSEKEEREQEQKKAKELAEQNKSIVYEYVENGQLPSPRALTRSERKKLDAAGQNIYKIKVGDTRSLPEIREECSDWILDNIFGDFEIPDNVPSNVCLWFGLYVFGLTYRDDLAEKN
ncbi:MAG: hypothetical protein E6713_02980 [Sporomusaceae bacterium]|nr:hypothetical protein [Sporomusaceae bacterium]